MNGTAGAARLIPDCRVQVQGKPLVLDQDAALVRAEVDLDASLIGQCVLSFVDPRLVLINGATFSAGVSVSVQLGFGAQLRTVFEGEVVELRPRFVRDLPPTLEVVCQEGLHRLALSQSTRAMNDVDDRQVVARIAREHGLDYEAPEGSREHVLQSNVTDAQFLRRLAQRHGYQVRLEGKTLIVGPPRSSADVTLGPGDGIRKIRVRFKSSQQVGSVSVHGWDPRNRREIVGRAQPAGETGEGARAHGGAANIAVAGHEPAPVDVATAESMASARMRKLAEGFVTAEMELSGDARLLPGKAFALEKIDDKLDGKYRVERAIHRFDKHGYLLKLHSVRVGKKPPARPAATQVAQAPQPLLKNARWSRPEHAHGDEAELRVDAENLEGREVYFVVEHKAGHGWVFWDEVSGTVRGGSATASVMLEHPAVIAHGDAPMQSHERGKVGGSRDFRFTARLTSRGGRTRPRSGPPRELTNARFGAAEVQAGQEVDLLVDAHNCEGQAVRFQIEHDEGSGEWVVVQEARAVVASNRASVRVRLAHPAISAHRAEPGRAHERERVSGSRNFRFTASLEGGSP